MLTAQEVQSLKTWAIFYPKIEFCVNSKNLEMANHYVVMLRGMIWGLEDTKLIDSKTATVLEQSLDSVIFA